MKLTKHKLSLMPILLAARPKWPSFFRNQLPNLGDENGGASLPLSRLMAWLDATHNGFYRILCCYGT